MKRSLLFLPFILLFLNQTFAAQVKGTVKDTQGNMLSFASVYVKNSTLGVATDLKGRYVFELEPGTHILVFSYLGYESFEAEITLTKGQILSLDVILKENSTQLGVVEVVGDTKGLAKEIMAKVRANRKHYLNQIKTYQCQTYTKTTLDRKLIKPSKSDTLLIVDDENISKRKKRKNEDKRKEIKENREAFFNKNNLEFSEVVSQTFFKSPNTFKEKIIGNQDFSEKFKPNMTVSIYSDYGEIAPVQWKTENPNLIYNVTDPDFNLYKNSINFPRVIAKPILSPLAFNAPLSYKYNFEGSFIEDGHKIYKIKVIPRFKGDALFNGILFIQDSTFSIKSIDLEINRDAMFACKDFKILQNYELIDGKYSVPVRREIVYTIKEGKNNFIGNVSVRHKNYKINPKFPKRFFTTEVRTYAEDAFDKDSLFWNEIRPITLKKEEAEFIVKADSVQHYYESTEYKEKQDSIYNDISIWDVLLNGFGHRDYKKRYDFWIFPFIEQMNFLGVGGYRHKLGGLASYEFVNNNRVHFDGFVDYGYVNKDVKGKLGVGFTFLPKKFMRTFVRFGDFYDQINNYEAIEAIFSRGNYVRTKTYSIEQKLEIVNGLFAEVIFNFSDQLPISNLDLSKDLFSPLGDAFDFDRYKKAELSLRLQYRPFQKYYYSNNKKVILGTDWPEFFLEYRKGLPNIFGSEVNYDFLELGVQDYRRIGRWGYSNWATKIGSFLTSKNLRFFELKFFRASDQYFFSNPVKSFQLLSFGENDLTNSENKAKTLSTRNAYLHGNYIHHFEGTIMNKIPLVRYLKLELAGGAGFLLIQDNNFAHVELFAGIERKFRIFRQMVRFGVYGVTSDNTLSKVDATWKFGISFYNDYSRRWDY